MDSDIALPGRGPDCVMLKIFLVDDSAPVRERIEAMLASIPCLQVIGQAADADAAVRGILDGQPDIVVLDLKLGEASGFDVLRALREAGSRAEVYMLSNFATPAYRRRAEQLGARGFFDKSTEFENLRAVIAARSAE
jgi:DNA-binding NarL/FixJ family response regulator